MHAVGTPLASAIDAAAATAPAGVVIRAWQGPSDYEAMVAVFRAARTVDGTDWDLSPAILAADIAGQGSRPQDCILIADLAIR